MVRKTKPWSKRDLKILRDVYPNSGTPGVRAKLPDRTAQAIHMKAAKEGLQCAKFIPVVPMLLAGEKLEEALGLYEDGVQLEEIARRIGMNAQTVTNAVLVERAKRAGTAAERDADNRLTPAGREKVHEALRLGWNGAKLQRILGITAGQASNERRRYELLLAKQGLPPLPPREKPPRQLAPEKAEKIEEAIEAGKPSREIAKELQTCRRTIARVSKEAEGARIAELDEALREAERQRQKRLAREAAEAAENREARQGIAAEFVKQAGGDVGLARQLQAMANGAPLVRKIDFSSPPTITGGGVVGEINI